MVEAGLEIMKDVEDGQLITSLQMFFANPVIVRADALLRTERIADATRDRLPREIDCFEPRPGVLMQGRQNQWKLCPFFGARPSRCLFSHEKTLLGPKRRTARPPQYQLLHHGTLTQDPSRGIFRDLTWQL